MRLRIEIVSRMIVRICLNNSTFLQNTQMLKHTKTFQIKTYSKKKYLFYVDKVVEYVIVGKWNASLYLVDLVDLSESLLANKYNSPEKLCIRKICFKNSDVKMFSKQTSIPMH